MAVSQDVLRIIETIRKTGQKTYNEAYLVEGDIEREATYVAGLALKQLADQLEIEFIGHTTED